MRDFNPETTMTPGAPRALRNGCRCAVLDNSHGRGGPAGEFWVNGDCPLHGAPDAPLDPAAPAPRGAGEGEE